MCFTGRLLIPPLPSVRERDSQGQAVRNDSYGLEHTVALIEDRDLEDCRIFDLGDLELAIGDSELVLSEIEKTAETILKDKKLPFMIGGEHLVTLGAVRAAARQYPELHIIHLDAHTDLREDYLGVKLSHAAVIRRCWDILGDSDGSTSLEYAPEKRASLTGQDPVIRIFILLLLMIFRGFCRS